MQNENKERKKIRNFIKENKAFQKIRDFVKDSETFKKIRGFIKVNKPVGIAVTVLVCLILVGVSYTVYAKYYKTGFNKGMSTASGFYFNSNLMASVPELDVASEEDLYIIPNDILESIIVSSNPTAWAGGDVDYPFDVEVRNFDNQLLYNDKDLNVEYAVYFVLLDKPTEGSTYFVTPEGGTAEELKWDDENDRGVVKSFTEGTLLPGGRTSWDTYRVSIGTTATDIYVPSRVLMVAYPTGPDYLQGTKSIAGMVKAEVQERKFVIEKQGFTICERADYLTTAFDDWKTDVILNESGFVYHVYTSGNFSGNGSAARKRIQLVWRRDMFKINYYDTYYQELMALKDSEPDFDISERYYAASADVEYDEKDKIINISNITKAADDDVDAKWQVMEIDVLPYASLKFTFFRNDGDEKNPGFVDAIEKSKDRDVFENSAFVRLLDEDEDEDEDEGGDPDSGNP